MNFPWKKEKWLPGVLGVKQMRQIIDYGLIEGIENFADAVDHSSLDLHLSKEGYLLKKGSIKPCGVPFKTFYTNTEFAEPIIPENDNTFNLKAKNCYLFKLKERLTPLALNSCIYGQATAKSSVGRMDVIARLIVDGMYQYETLDPTCLENGTGDMFLEITPITFNVKVKEGISLSQIRFIYGNIEDAIIRGKAFLSSLLIGNRDEDECLSVNLESTEVGGVEVSAFKAIDSTISNEKKPYLDLWEEKYHDPCKHWTFESYYEVDGQKRLKIDTNQFYILRSKEKMALPAGVAVYCRAMDESLGEMRIHYAGFVHPFFGIGRKDKKAGTPLIFEVRGHNVDVNLADNEKLARLIFYRMSIDANQNDLKDLEKEKKKEEKPKVKKEEKKNDKEKNAKDAYQNQELHLSKFFGEWPTKLRKIKGGKVEKED